MRFNFYFRAYSAIIRKRFLDCNLFYFKTLKVGRARINVSKDSLSRDTHGGRLVLHAQSKHGENKHLVSESSRALQENPQARGVSRKFYEHVYARGHATNLKHRLAFVVQSQTNNIKQ